MSSIEPNECTCELNGGKEITFGFVVAGCNGAELLKSGEEILDQMTSFKEVSIIFTTDLAIGLGRNDCDLAGYGERHKDPFIGVECLVGDEYTGLHGWQKVIGSDKIMRFAAGQEEADRIAQGIDQGVDFRAQSSARSADRLVFAGFFLAPALC